MDDRGSLHHSNTTGDSTPMAKPSETSEKPEVFSTVATGAIEEGASRQSPRTHIGPPPDGGFRAWLTVLGSFFAVFTQFGLGTYATGANDLALFPQLQPQPPLLWALRAAGR
jgi:hypothetical protein